MRIWHNLFFSFYFLLSLYVSCYSIVRARYLYLIKIYFIACSSWMWLALRIASSCLVFLVSKQDASKGQSSNSPAVHLQPNPIGKGCRICRLHLFRGLRQPPSFNECSGYDTKPLDGEVPVLKIRGMWSRPFIIITPRSTLIWSGSTC